MSHPVDELMEKAMANLKSMVDVNTIVGEAVSAPEGTVIIPVSKVSFGFVAGGSDFGGNDAGDNANFGGGSGGGVTISPVAFLVANSTQIKMLPVDAKQTTVDKVLDYVPVVIDKVNAAINNKKKDKKTDKDPNVTVEATFEE